MLTKVSMGGTADLPVERNEGKKLKGGGGGVIYFEHTKSALKT